jgi:putative flavoprotein involved in K+ transport
MVEEHDVVVVGAGQAGLAMSWHLRERGIEHVVLERGRVGERWRCERWDSLMFQFPNSVLGLPGMPYDGGAPDGFSDSGSVVDLIQRYADLNDAPVREATDVLSVAPGGQRWRLVTSAGEMDSRAVVLATGPFQAPVVPDLASSLPDEVAQLHASAYRNPAQLPPGGVLVVGTGASGAQITEELLAAGRRVHLSVSRHRRIPRRFRGHDVFWWLERMGWLDRTRDDWPDGRMPPSLVVTGVGGGHDVDVRVLQRDGATLVGRVVGVDDGRVGFADDASALLDAADAAYEGFVVAAEEHARQHDVDAPPHEPPRPLAARVPPVAEVDLRAAGITSVLWSTGYRLDLGWVRVPIVGTDGSASQERGVTAYPGLYLLGLHWMHTFKSGTFLGVGDDAGFLAGHIGAFIGAAPSSS